MRVSRPEIAGRRGRCAEQRVWGRRRCWRLGPDCQRGARVLGWTRGESRAGEAGRARRERAAVGVGLAGFLGPGFGFEFWFSFSISTSISYFYF
jgi:hypothetical protein